MKEPYHPLGGKMLILLFMDAVPLSWIVFPLNFFFQYNPFNPLRNLNSTFFLWIVSVLLLFSMSIIGISLGTLILFCLDLLFAYFYFLLLWGLWRRRVLFIFFLFGSSTFSCFINQLWLHTNTLESSQSYAAGIDFCIILYWSAGEVLLQAACLWGWLGLCYSLCLSPSFWDQSVSWSMFFSWSLQKCRRISWTMLAIFSHCSGFICYIPSITANPMVKTSVIFYEKYWKVMNVESGEEL